MSKTAVQEAPPAGPFSGFERMVAWRYLRSRRKETVISVIASISFLGIMLGVATLIVVMAVMNGFRAELLTRILGINGHLIVTPVDMPLEDYAEVAKRIDGVSGVKYAIPLIDGQVLAQGNVGSGTETSLLDLAHTFACAMGRPALNPVHLEARAVNPVPRRLASVEAAKDSLGFETGVAPDEGIADLVGWWRGEMRANAVREMAS